MTDWITKKSDSDKETKSWITKKKKDKKFYGYTGPVKPETKSKYIQKKSDKKFENNTSYGYSGKPREVKKKNT